MVIWQYRYINVIWDLIISVVLCVFSGCLAPERARHGSARPALWMDLDEICMLAHKLFTFANSLWLWTESSLLHAMTHFFICVHLKDDYYCGAEEVQNLRSLVLNLRQLLDLHQKYSCGLSLSVFEKVFTFVTFFKHVPLSVIWPFY